jgi:tetratricopeptide (TPR) repeat protein
MAAAREYKKNVSTANQSPPTSGSPAPPAPSATTQPKELEKAPDTVLAALDAYATRQAQDEAADFLQAQEQIQASKPSTPSTPPTTTPPKEEERSDNGGFRRGVSGTANQAATWLQTDSSSSSSSSQIDKNLSPEQFTLRKEEIQRERGAEIERAKGVIVGTRRRFDNPSDDDYGLAQQQDEAEAAMAKERANMSAAKAAKAAAAIAAVEQENAAEVEETQESKKDDEHNPAVATWGVFPRPKNISEAYGGGRNLKPGQALETEDQAAERQKRVSAALLEYKKSMGLDIDPAVESKAQKLYEQGEILFKDGRITEALKIFSEAAALVPLKTKIGGQLYLQKAICLDSLGMNEEAYKIYNSLKGHNGPGVAKAARRFLFGWDAARELKVEMKYDNGGSQVWQSYFEKFNAGTWAEYRAKQEESVEDEESAKKAARLATAVMLIPLAIIASIIYLK